jgi:hypothetical protein
MNKEQTITVNPLGSGGSHHADKELLVGAGLLILDPRDPLPEGHTGFEVLTAKDGGKCISWSRRNFEQINEARRLFNELIAQGLVPYYVDQKTGQASARVMDEFDAAEGETMFEKIVFAPTPRAVGG